MSQTNSHNGNASRRCGSMTIRPPSVTVLLMLSALSGCGGGVLDPQGPVGAGYRQILLNSLAVMLVIVVPTVIAELWFAWWFRAERQNDLGIGPRQDTLSSRQSPANSVSAGTSIWKNSAITFGWVPPTASHPRRSTRRSYRRRPMRACRRAWRAAADGGKHSPRVEADQLVASTQIGTNKRTS